MEVSFVRQQLLAAIDRANKSALGRRQRGAQAEQAYERFLADVATPVARQLVIALKAQGLPFSIATPGHSVLLTSDNARDDMVAIVLDTAVDPPAVVVRTSRGRGSRLISDERPLKPDAAPDIITEHDTLAALLDALQPWLERR